MMMGASAGRLMACILAVAAWSGQARSLPDRVAWSVDLGTEITKLAISDDGMLVGMVESSTREVILLDVATWETTAIAPCGSGSPAAVALHGTDGAWQGFAGCSDGTVVELELDRSGFGFSEQGYAVADDGDLVGLEMDSTHIFAVVKPPDGNHRVHSVDISSMAVDDYGYFPTTLGMGGFQDTAINDTVLLVLHGNDDVSKVDLDTGNAALSSETLGGRRMVDIHAWGNNSVYVADTTGGVIRFNLGSNDYDIMLDTYDGLVSNSAVAVDGDAGEPYLLVYDDGPGEAVVFSYSTTSQSPGDIEQERFSMEHAADLAVGDGYVFAGGATGALQVLTDRPWVTVESVSEGVAISGDELAVEFSADMSGSFEVVLGGELRGSGTQIDSGQLSAGETIRSTFTVDDSFAEGVNRIWVLVTAGGRDGHGAALVTVDNPPARVDLQASGVGFGNGLMNVTFPGITDEDLDAYLFYITTTPFEPEDWPVGGPGFDGPDELESPIEVQAAPGEQVSTTISPLTNGTTYYVGVKARDQGGQESEMSEVHGTTPRETVGAAALAGEPGGYCGSRLPVGFLVMGLSAALVAARRRVAPALVGLALIAPASASAGGGTTSNIEVRYGPYFVEHEAVQAVYGESGHRMLWIEGGPKLGRILELDMGLGYYSNKSTMVAADDQEASSEPIRLRAYPVTAGLTFRLHLLEDQFLVPTATAGLDYWLWQERWEVGEDSDGVAGGSAGYHYGLGLNLLLNTLEPSRASKLEVSWGIVKTYLVAEWRRQVIGPWSESGSSLFGGSMVTVGLKFDM